MTWKLVGVCPSLPIPLQGNLVKLPWAAGFCSLLDSSHHAAPLLLQVTSYHLARRLEAEVVNGPPLTEDRVPFSWQGRWGNPQYVHRGHPTTFNFSFERMSTKDLPLIADGDRED